MSDLLGAAARTRMAVTAQRRVVAEVLDGDHVHLTADEVHSRAVAQTARDLSGDGLQHAGELVPLGEVLEVSTDKRAKRYDPNAHSPHHHLVCATAARSATSTRAATPRRLSPTRNASASRSRTSR